MLKYLLSPRVPGVGLGAAAYRNKGDAVGHGSLLSVGRREGN